MSQLRQERDMLAVKSEFWRMSKRISGWDLVCTDSMPFDHSNHSNHTLPCQKQIARWTASHFFHDWIHLKGDSGSSGFSNLCTIYHLHPRSHRYVRIAWKSFPKGKEHTCATFLFCHGTPFWPQLWMLLHFCCCSLRFSYICAKIRNIRFFPFVNFHLSQSLVSL